MTRILVPSSRPRNPLVAPAHFRRAGRHGHGDGAERREGRQALERELAKLDLPRNAPSKPPSP